MIIIYTFSKYYLIDPHDPLIILLDLIYKQQIHYSIAIVFLYMIQSMSFRTLFFYKKIKQKKIQVRNFSMNKI